ncbi:hypothetical protein [Paenibacillus xerothermodurans]|nr:hypothetical protein [Paenibacillus xerothermodurans]
MEPHPLGMMGDVPEPMGRHQLQLVVDELRAQKAASMDVLQQMESQPSGVLDGVQEQLAPHPLRMVDELREKILPPLLVVGGVMQWMVTLIRVDET